MAPGKHPDFRLTGDACILGALALLLLPLNWLVAAILAASFHELCHYLALRICGVRMFGLRIGSGGALMETESMDARRELICALSGPAGSILLLSVVRWMPELAICAGIQGLFNLLPLYPLDGGRAVRSLLTLLWPDRREQFMKGIQNITITMILLAGLVAYLYFKLGFGVLLLAFFLIHKALGIKIPCKAARKRVQ